jgi:hypothetical protein
MAGCLVRGKRSALRGPRICSLVFITTKTIPIQAHFYAPPGKKQSLSDRAGESDGGLWISD